MATEKENADAMAIVEISAILAGHVKRSLDEAGISEGAATPVSQEALIGVLKNCLEMNAEVLSIYATRFSEDGNSELLAFCNSALASTQLQLSLMEPGSDIEPSDIAEHMVDSTIFTIEELAGQGGLPHAEKIGGALNIYGKISDYKDLLSSALNGDISGVVGLLSGMIVTSIVGGLVIGAASAGAVVSLPILAIGAVVTVVASALVGDAADSFIEDLFEWDQEPEDQRANAMRRISFLINNGVGAHLPQLGDYVNFGTSGDDVISAQYNETNASILIGGDGSDIIYGDIWTDRISGGAGADSLHGMEGDDYIKPGEGDDRVSGGRGNDVIEDSGGFDTYMYETADLLNPEFQDTIIDSDGAGKILFNSLNIAGTGLGFNDIRHASLGAWETSGREFRISIIGAGTATQSLLIIRLLEDGKVGGQILVKNWSNGDLGITLPGIDAPPILGGGLLGVGDDLFGESDSNAGNDLINGLSGNDGMSGGAGDDWLSGDAGDDLVFGSSGGDRIYGNGGNDFLLDGSESVSMRKWDDVDHVYEGGKTEKAYYEDEISRLGASVFMRGAAWYIYGDAEGSSTIGGINANFSVDPNLFKSGDDFLDGGAGNDVLRAGEGSDILVGGADNDMLDGGHDDDILSGGDGNDKIFGDANEDSVAGIHFTLLVSSAANPNGNDVIDAGIGDDYVEGNGGSDIISGGAGNDRLWGRGDNRVVDQGDLDKDYIDGGDGNDQVIGDDGDDTISGGAGDDVIRGDNEKSDVRAGHDSIDGGDGDDQIAGDGGDDVIDGGVGADVIQGDSASLDGSKHGNDLLYGGGGNDIVVGQGGDDIIFGSDGDDQILGDADESQLALSFHGNDTISGGAGDDIVFGGGGNDIIDGGDDNDQISGNAGNDTLIGGKGADALFGADGNDILQGDAGDDALSGGIGDDRLSGGDGHDQIDGHEGNDVLNGGAGDDILWGRVGNDSMHGGNGDDQLAGGDGQDDLAGGSGADSIWGEEGNDVINGDAGDDFLYGGDGEDVLIGSAGGDFLRGENGDDFLEGGAGDDGLNGGYGFNTYKVSPDTGNDIIYAMGTSIPVGVSVGGSLIIGGGIQPNDVMVEMMTDGVSVKLHYGSSSVVIGGFLLQYDPAQGGQSFQNMSPVTSIVFDDNTVWRISDIWRAYLSTGYTPGDDTRQGFDSNDAINGGDGNDTLSGMGGDDALYGGNGNDVLMAGSGTDILDGGDGNDNLSGDAGNDVLVGGEGNDSLSGGDGDDTLSGGSGSDTLAGGYGDDSLDGGAGSDTYMFTTAPGIDVMLIGQSDVIQISADQYIYELIFKRNGDDLIISSVRHQGVAIGRDFFVQGRNAYVKLLDLNNYWRNLSAADIQSYPWALTPTYGSNWSADTISGTVSADRIYGLGGNDKLSGGVGDDYLSGGIGDDIIQGDSGSDHMLGDAGNDRFVILTETGASDYAEGGEGSDVYEIAPSGGVVTIGRLSDSGSSVDQIKIAALISEVVNFEMLDGGLRLIVDKAGVETSILLAGFVNSGVQHQVIFSDGTILTANDLKWTGTIGNDTYTGTVRPDIIYGLAGDDVLSGGAANDTLYGEDGTDVLNGDDGRDKLYGGLGNDLLDGGSQNDELYGDEGNDRLEGGDGDDQLIGGAGSDELYGGAGSDVLRNAWGLWGENSLDQAYGGVGDDTYIYTDSTFYHGGSTLNHAYVHENPDEGVDVIRSNYYNIALPENFENLIVEGINVQWSSQGADYQSRYIYRNFTGNSSDNIIQMDSGESARWFDSGKYHVVDGGAGNDTLIGSNANEVYVVDSFGDVIIEAGSSNSIDTVRASMSYSLAGLTGIENIELTADNTTATGDSGKNQLNGSMAYGANTLIGGDGDDTYIIDYLDTVVETATGGNDKVIVKRVESGAFEVPAGSNIETFQLDASLSNQVVLQGNAEGNILIGNTSANTLRGGAGNDQLIAAGNVSWYEDYLYGDEGDDLLIAESGSNWLVGGTGNDHIEVHSGTDQVIYNQGDDIDTISARDILNSGGTDTLNFGASISSDQTVWTRDGNDLLITFANAATDSVAIRDYWMQVEGVDVLSGVIDQFSFHNESGYRTGLTIGALQNRAPISNYATLNTVASAGLSFTYTLPEGAFSDEDVISLVYSVGNIPSWLSFDPETRTFQGTPPVGEPEGYINVTATDVHGASASLTLNVSVMNVVQGTSGNDTLTGSSAMDMLIGGAGDDIYTVDNPGDLVIEEADQGNDLINASVSYDLPDYVERLTLVGSARGAYGNQLDNTLTGNSYDNYLAGDAGNDTLAGNNGNDELDGGNGNDTLDGGSGIDYMYGGDGDDTYIVGSTDDQVEEWEYEGVDTVRSSVTYTLGKEVENLVLTGSSGLSGNGNELSNVLTGNGGANTLRGYEGNDYLDGGSGSDTMIGGAGDDTYVVNTTSDVVNEQASQGIDTVRSSVTLTLGANVENLVLTGTSAINGTGNVLDNLLTGNSGTNTLTGAAGNDTLDGAAGTDTLTGGAGSDTYLHGRGYGADTSIENDTTAGVTDVVRFLTGVNYDQLWFAKPSGTNNLEISIIGSVDKLTIKDWYVGNQYRVEEIRTVDGNYLLTAAKVQTLVSVMATMTKPTTTSLSASQRSQLESTFASTWAQQQSEMSARTPDVESNTFLTTASDPQQVTAPADSANWDHDLYMENGLSKWGLKRQPCGWNLDGEPVRPYGSRFHDHRQVAPSSSQELHLLVEAMALGRKAAIADSHILNSNEALTDRLGPQLFHGKIASRFNQIE